MKEFGAPTALGLFSKGVEGRKGDTETRGADAEAWTEADVGESGLCGGRSPASLPLDRIEAALT